MAGQFVALFLGYQAAIPAPLFWTLVGVSFLLHPLGIMTCLLTRGGWRNQKTALLLNLAGLTILPTAVVVTLLAFGQAIREYGLIT